MTLEELRALSTDDVLMLSLAACLRALDGMMTHLGMCSCAWSKTGTQTDWAHLALELERRIFQPQIEETKDE